jgi:hypothetical protein
MGHWSIQLSLRAGALPPEPIMSAVQLVQPRLPYCRNPLRIHFSSFYLKRAEGSDFLDVFDLLRRI